MISQIEQNDTKIGCHAFGERAPIRTRAEEPVRYNDRPASAVLLESKVQSGSHRK